MDETNIICAGIPRSGTTMMFRALAGLPRGSTTPDLPDCPILKTHSFRPEEFTGAGKAFFLFGDPVASVVSTRASRFDKRHFQNCGAGHLDPETTDIYDADLLNYEKMFDAWTRRQPFDVMCLRYETLHAHVEQISRFLGRRLRLPRHRPRQTEPHTVVDEATLARVHAAYAGLIQKIACAPDLAIYRKAGDGAG